MRPPQASEEALRRLPPAGFVMLLADGFRAAILPSLPVFATGRVGFVLAAFLLFSVGGALVYFVRFRYALTGDTMLVQGGMLFRWRRVIPVARVQSVEVVQKLRHRLLGVVELRIEAIGGARTEATIVALPPEEAEHIRSALLHGSRPEDEETATEEPPLAQLAPRDLVVFGATGGRVAILSVLLGNLFQFRPRGVIEEYGETLEGTPAETLALLVGGLVVGVVVVSVLISIAATVFVFWGFTLRRDGDRLMVTRGLLERRRYVVPLWRVQTVELRENLIRRAFGLASLTVRVAGQAGSSADVSRSSILLPLGSRSEVIGVAERALGAHLDEPALEPAPRAALFRRLTIGVLLLAPATGVAAGIAGRWGLLALLAAPIVGGYCFASWRALGYAAAPGYALVRWGALERKTVLVRMRNIQAPHLSISPLQRPFGLASLDLPPARGEATARDLPIPRARVAFERVRGELVG